MRTLSLRRFSVTALALVLAGGTLRPPAGAAPAPAKAAAPAATRPAKSASTASRLERVAQALDAERTRLQIPGLAIAIVEGDRVTLLRGFGVRDLASRLPVDSATVFPIGSCTKAFTALAAEISQDEGKLSLDDSPRRFLPWFHMADPEADQLVTLRDLLSHRTGLMAYADLAAEPHVLSRLDYVRAACGAKPTARFREKFQYSNAAIVAAAEAVAAAQHTTWERLIEDKILTPLGMRSSAASAADLQRFANHATGYAAPHDSGVRRAVPPPASLQALAPAGAIISSASDMARWVRLMLAEGTFEGRRIVSAAGIRDVETPHTVARPGFSYGLCWGLYDWNGHHVVEHTGGSDGIAALVSLMPEKKLGFVLLANSTPTSLTKVTSAGRIVWPILTGEAEKEPPAAPPQRSSLPAGGTKTEGAPPDTTNLPNVRDLLGRVLAAAGGERNLRAHRSVEIVAHKAYLNHGIEAEVTRRWARASRLEDEERWSAANHSIGWIRFFRDGDRAGQETSFGQDQMFSGDELDRAKRNATLDWFLEPSRFGLKARVVAREKRGDEPVYVVEVSSARGSSRYAVSARTSLVLERVSGGGTETYSDFRSVEGCVWPFRTTIQDELGESELVVRSVRYDISLPSGAFGPRKPTTVPATAGR